MSSAARRATFKKPGTTPAGTGPARNALRSRFRRRFCNALEHLIQNGRIELPPDMARIDALCRINQARRKKWIVDVRERYEHGHGVAAYLARYVRGGPIKNQRIRGFDGRTVTFRISRKGEKLRLMELSLSEFIRRILLHVPPKGYRVVRACGLYHHYYSEQLEICRAQLGGGGIPDPDPEAPDDEAVDSIGNDRSSEEEYCRVCGCRLEIEVLPRGPPPPELAIYLGPKS